MKKSLVSLFLIYLMFNGISCNKEVSVSPLELPIYTGLIYIESNPSGAKIYLNNRNTGKITPDSLKWLEAGEYTITLKLQDWKDILTKVMIDEKNNQKLFIDFTTNPLMYGAIEVKSLPTGAQIFLNSENTLKITPAVIDSLLPGKYNIKLHKDRYWEDTIQVKVESQKTTSIYRVLADTAKWVVFSKYNCPLPSNSILSVAIEINNVKWIGTNGGGLAEFDDREWKIYNKNNSPLPDNSINVVYIDRQNNKWLGTLNSGLVKYDGHSWTVYNNTNSQLPSDKIWAINEDIDGKIWIGTYDKGIAVYDGINWHVYNTGNSGLTSNFITSLAIDKNGNKWIGTAFDGIVKYNGNTWEKYNSNNSWMADVITAISVDVSGNIWAGITNWDNYPGGIYKFDNSKGWILFSSYFSDRISCIISDLSGRLWIGSYNNGFGLIEGRFIYRDIYNNTNSPIRTNIVNSIAIDVNGNKWIGTGADGLIKFKFKN